MKTSGFVDYIEDRLTVDLVDVYKYRMVKVFVVFKVKLKPARATAIDLVLITKLTDFT